MLSIQDIDKLAQEHGLELTAHYPQASQRGIEPPKPERLSIWFLKESVVAWEALMMQPTEVPVVIYGTRQSTSSGATDNMLYPCYLARLDAVNAARSLVGLARVYG